MSNLYKSTLASAGTAPTGDAVAADVLAGKTFSNASATGVTGTMVNNGAVSGTASSSQPYTIPAGYHNGQGVVTAIAGQIIGSIQGGSNTTFDLSSAQIGDLIIGSGTPLGSGTSDTVVGLTVRTATAIQGTASSYFEVTGDSPELKTAGASGHSFTGIIVRLG